ncbi:MAG: hypothetical protein VXC58_15445 [Deltaproteobacteria bacterium]
MLPSTPVILREAEGEVAESTDMKNSNPPGEEGTLKTMGEGKF